MPSRLQPALLGGLFIGVLSALPIVQLGNCCCLWVIGGGIIAAYLTQQTSLTAITIGDGAIAGLSAGLVGALIDTLFTIPIRLVFGDYQRRMFQRIMENAGRDMPFGPFNEPTGLGYGVALIGGFIVMLIICAIFATVGGMIGAAIFNRDKPKVIEGPPQPPYPPPPPQPPYPPPQQ